MVPLHWKETSFPKKSKRALFELRKKGRKKMKNKFTSTLKKSSREAIRSQNCTFSWNDIYNLLRFRYAQLDISLANLFLSVGIFPPPIKYFQEITLHALMRYRIHHQCLFSHFFVHLDFKHGLPVDFSFLKERWFWMMTRESYFSWLLFIYIIKGCVRSVRMGSGGSGVVSSMLTGV